MKRSFVVLLGIAVLTFVCVGSVWAKAAKIEDGKKVQFDYTLKVDDEIIDTSEGRKPLEYVHGSGAIIPGLAAELKGMKVGEEKSITIAPEQAYGMMDPRALKEIPRTSFPEDFDLKIGMVLEAQSPEGQTIPGIVWALKDDSIVLNFNHPLAGKTLNFDVKIVAIE